MNTGADLERRGAWRNIGKRRWTIRARLYVKMDHDHGDAPCWLACGWVDHPYLDLCSYRDRVSVIKIMGKQRN